MQDNFSNLPEVCENTTEQGIIITGVVKEQIAEAQPYH